MPTAKQTPAAKFKAGEYVFLTDDGIEIAGGALRTREDAAEITGPIRIEEVSDVDDHPNFQDISFWPDAGSEKGDNVPMWRKMIYDTFSVRRPTPAEIKKWKLQR